MLAAITLGSCKSDELDIVVNYPEQITLRCGETYSLAPEIDEENPVIPASWLDMTFSSDDENIVSVSNDDLEMKAKYNPGTTNVRVYNKDKELIKIIKVTVIPNQSITSITISEGEAVHLKSMFDVKYDNYKFYSLDENIVKISLDKYGEPIAIGMKKGTAYVICTKYGYETTVTTCEFIVK